MVRPQFARRVITVVLLAAAICSVGCRQVSRRATSPTPLPTYEAVPTMPMVPSATETPELSPIPPLPGQEAAIPAIPPSTAEAPRLEDHFGFTEPKLPASDDARAASPAITIPPALDEGPHSIQPTASDAAVSQSELAPLLTPLITPPKPRLKAPVELDQSLFLMELIDEAINEIPVESTVPTTVNGLTIQPWYPERQMPGASREPQPWPVDGVTPTLTITPGPVMSKWKSEPLPTRPANSRPRRLMIENSDSEIRPIE